MPILSIIGFVTASAVGVQVATPPPLQPGARWVVEYADNSCHIARTFGPAGKQVRLSMTLMPGRSRTQIFLEDDHEGKAPFERGDLKITPGANGEPFTVKGTSGSVKPGSRFLFAVLDEEQLELLERAGEIGFSYREQHFSLAAKSLKVALTAALTCEDDLLRTWKLDPVEFRKVAIRAKPLTSPALWLTNDDYPPDAMKANEQGMVGTRIDIAQDGKVVSCSIIKSSGFPRLDEQTCKLVKMRAGYRPARDANGDPIPSFSVLLFRWQTWPA